MENDILDKLDEKLRNIISLKIKVILSQDFKEFDDGFEEAYISERLEELLRDVDDCIEIAVEDITSEIQFDIDNAADAELEEPWHSGV